ncbi:MAG: AGE family epimerase/isomerase [Oscillospiraceae bacterium]|nr:AGE family epimerase/isomerase [Oscillospiraceae bacterium]
MVIFIMKEEIRKELTEHIIPFWDALIDVENGGFYGSVNHDLIVDKGGFKNAVLHSRILWFYSNCYSVLKKNEYLDMARHCYDFLIKNLLDRESGGVFWSVNVKGVPVDPMKHAYCNAFFLYAVSSYYGISRDNTALNNAVRIFELIETNMADKIGYAESFDRDWNAQENELLSRKDLKAEKTTGTVLHLIEAYTELYRVSKNGDVAARLKYLLQLVFYKIYDRQNHILPEFFDKNMNQISDIHLYGHDIEGAWVISLAADIAEETLDDELIMNVREMCRLLVEKSNETAFGGNGAMFYENNAGFVNKRRAWWVQAEALNAFSDAYERYGNPEYLTRAEGLWEYIKNYIIDKRSGGEWFNELDENEAPVRLPIVGDWKCPYHNGRMCLTAVDDS